MKKTAILSFIEEIMANGIKNNLPDATVSKSIKEYAKYLKANELADGETIEFILSTAKALFDVPSKTESNNKGKEVSNPVAQPNTSACAGGRSMGGRRSC